MSGLIAATSSRAILLKNENCPYCGTQFSISVPSEKEHAVGRRFVPKGTLNGQWNLIVRSCIPCNQDKAKLENDISAISMHPDATGQHVNSDSRLHAEANRKALNAISHKTKKPIANGEEPLKVSGNLGAADITFTFVMPPQVDEDRIFALARYQVGAFFI